MPRILRLVSALLVYASACTQLSSARTEVRRGFTITASAIEKVPASAQLSSNQLFTRTWQLRANTSANATVVERIETKVHGRIFISYVDAPASGDADVVAQVKVSGSAEEQVNFVVVENDLVAKGWGIDVGPNIDVRTPKDEGFLLTEILVHKKRRVKYISSGFTGDIVIEDNVLFSTTKEAFAALPAPAPRVGASVKSEKQGMIIGDSSWLIKPAANMSNTTAMTLGFTSLYKGPVNVTARCYLSPPYTKVGSVARVTTQTYNAKSNKVSLVSEVNVTRAGNADALTVQVESSEYGAKVVRMDVEIEALPNVQLELVDLTDNVNVHDMCNSGADMKAGFGLHFYGVIGNVFVVDRDADLYASDVFLEAPSSFRSPQSFLQVEVKSLTASNLALRSFHSGDVSFFSSGATTANSITATPNGNAKLCLSSSNDVKVGFLDPRKTAQVSYTGRAGGPAFECKKVAPPGRWPGPIGGSGATGSESTQAPKDGSLTSASATRSMHLAFLVAGLIAAAAMM